VDGHESSGDPSRTIFRGRVFGIVASGDPETKERITTVYHAFQEENVNRDKFVEFGIARGVSKIPKRVLLVSERSWWLTQTAFWVLTVFGMAWPHRLYLKKNFEEAVVFVVKRVFADVVHGSHAFDMAPLASMEEEVFNEETDALASDLHTSDLESDSEPENMV
jgi:hypothetical protein